MSKKLVVISTSLRADSNSEAMANSFAQGASEAGNDVQVISLRGKNLGFCVGCLACHSAGECVIKDDAIAITEAVLGADVVCFATPIYYYEMSGQMKTLLDRMNSMYTKDYRFRDVYMLSCAADDEEWVPDRAVAGLTGWIDCYPKSQLKDTVFCPGVGAPGDIAGNDALEKCCYFGKNI